MKPSILLSAFACDPATGSEPYVGWNWAQMLSSSFDVHVLTRTYSKALIERSGILSEVNFHYYDLPIAIKKNHHWKFIKIYYVVWQLLAYWKAKELNKRFRFSLVQHVTYNNVDVPGFLWLLQGPQFVWGPVGGGQTAPTELRVVYGTSWWKERLRKLIKSSARYNPIVRTALKRASLVFFANEETRNLVGHLTDRSILMLETGIHSTAVTDPVNNEKPCRSGSDRPTVQLLWLSHAFPRKGLRLALDALKEAVARPDCKVDFKLLIVGAGVSISGARMHAEDLGLCDMVEFAGAVPHALVSSLISNADVFLFTSVQDTSGNVILEAMVNKVPVVALNHQGARAILEGGGGILVPIEDYALTVRRYADAVLKLAHSCDLRRQLGAVGRRRALTDHSWAAKQKHVTELYSALLVQPL